MSQRRAAGIGKSDFSFRTPGAGRKIVDGMIGRAGVTAIITDATAVATGSPIAKIPTGSVGFSPATGGVNKLNDAVSVFTITKASSQIAAATNFGSSDCC